VSTRRDLRAAARTLEDVEREIDRLESSRSGSHVVILEGDVGGTVGISIAAARRYARASDLLDRNAEELERICRRMRR